MPTLITGTEFKSVEPLFGDGTSTNRYVYNRHGIRMIFVQDGKLFPSPLRFPFFVLITPLRSIGKIRFSSNATYGMNPVSPFIANRFFKVCFWFGFAHCCYGMDVMWRKWYKK